MITCAKDNVFLLKHMLVDLRHISGNQQPQLVEIKNGIIDPNALLPGFKSNVDNNGNSLKNRWDFLDWA